MIRSLRSAYSGCIKIGLLAAWVVIASYTPQAVRAQSFSGDSKWWTAPSTKQSCGNSYPTGRPIQPLDLRKTLKRQPYPKEYEINFVTLYAAQLARTIAGIDVPGFKKFILSVAEHSVYTKADMTTVWSPIYIQTNIVLLTAHYITYMEDTGQLSEHEKATLVNWVKPMIKGQKQRKLNGSADSMAASGIAMISWGSVTKDKNLMKVGYKNYKKGLDFVLRGIGDLKRHPDHDGIPVHVLSLYDEYNDAIGHVVMGAAVLENLGVDVYKTTHNGRSLHDAVTWWAGVVWSRRHDKPNDTSGFTGYRRHSLNDNLGWIPIYLARHSNNPQAGLLRKMARDVSKGRRPMFEATAIGGATDCLWGYRG